MKRAVGPLATRVFLLGSLGAVLTLGAIPAGADVVVPPGFTHATVVVGLTRPVDMEFAPDGRLFVAEQGGKVRIVKPNGTLATFLDFSGKVDSTGERGMMAIAFDPNFSVTRHVYLHYTKKTLGGVPPHNRVVRVTANGDRVVAGSEKLLLRLNDQDDRIHMGGAIDFGTDGKLYVVTGDNLGGPTQTLGNLLGKMLRINRNGTIPTTNPFYGMTTGRNRAIWALGLRNPFRFAVQPRTGTIFINDVGQDTWEEINRGAPGANYGWNIYEGAEADPAFEDPIFAYGHDGDPATTGCAITGGTFYDPQTALFPTSYVGDYFFADFCNGWIRSYDPATSIASGFATGLSSIVDIEVATTGELYYLSRSNGVGKFGFSGAPVSG